MSSSQSVDAADLLASASELGTATLHEAAGRRGALPRRIRQITAGLAMAGRAFTVVCPPMDNLWLHRAVSMAKPGDVLIADVGGAVDGGYWGEILSHAAVARGLAGLVIDGCVRDSARLAAIGLPVFARGICIEGTGKDDGRTRGGVGSVLRLGTVAISPGDFVIGDEDGVAAFAATEMPEIIDISKRRALKEIEYVRKIQSGVSTLELLGLD